MIPILYSKGVSSFVASNCKGRLTDAISCKITQELNGMYELELVYPTDGPRFAELMAGGVIMALRQRARVRSWQTGTRYLEAFDIYKSSVNNDGLATFNACHISYRLNNSVITGLNVTTAYNAITSISANATPSISDFTLSAPSVTSPMGYYRIQDIRTVRQAISGNEGSICSFFGLEAVYDKFKCYLESDSHYYSGIDVHVGGNMTDGLAERDESQTFNAIAPFYLKDGVRVVANPLVVQPTTAITPVKVVPRDMTSDFDTQPSASDLATAARAWLDANKPWERYETIHVDFSPIGMFTNADMGSYVRVFWGEGDLVGTSVRIVKVVYDPIMERYDSMELGTLEKGYVATESW